MEPIFYRLLLKILISWKWHTVQILLVVLKLDSQSDKPYAITAMSVLRPNQLLHVASHKAYT